MLLGALANPEKHLYSSHRAVPSGYQEQHNILPLSNSQGRFTLLPLSTSSSQSLPRSLPRPVPQVRALGHGGLFFQDFFWFIRIFLIYQDFPDFSWFFLISQGFFWFLRIFLISKFFLLPIFMLFPNFSGFFSRFFMISQVFFLNSQDFLWFRRVFLIFQVSSLFLRFFQISQDLSWFLMMFPDFSRFFLVSPNFKKKKQSKNR